MLSLKSKSSSEKMKQLSLEKKLYMLHGMYDKVKHNGKSLLEWQKGFNNAFTLGELYQMHIGKSTWPSMQSA